MCMTRLLIAPKVPKFEGQRVSSSYLEWEVSYTIAAERAENHLQTDLKSGHGRGTTRAEDAQEPPTQSQISPSLLEYEEKKLEYRTWQHNVPTPDITGLFVPFSLDSGHTSTPARLDAAFESDRKCFQSPFAKADSRTNPSTYSSHS